MYTVYIAHRSKCPESKQVYKPNRDMSVFKLPLYAFEKFFFGVLLVENTFIRFCV